MFGIDSFLIYMMNGLFFFTKKYKSFVLITKDHSQHGTGTQTLGSQRSAPDDVIVRLRFVTLHIPVHTQQWTLKTILQQECPSVEGKPPACFDLVDGCDLDPFDLHIRTRRRYGSDLLAC